MKKNLCCLLLLCVLFCMAGCHADARFGFAELNARIRAADKSFCFREDTVFFSDDVYYAYYSVQDKNDLLLTMREDADRKLDRICLTLSAASGDASDQFTSFASLLADLFIPDCDLTALYAATGLDGAQLFRPFTAKYTQGRYTAVMFGSSYGVCFFIQRI